jgi:hypothetical protein
VKRDHKVPLAPLAQRVQQEQLVLQDLLVRKVLQDLQALRERLVRKALKARRVTREIKEKRGAPEQQDLQVQQVQSGLPTYSWEQSLFQVT